MSAALGKLAYMEELVNDRLLQDRTTTEINQPPASTSTSIQPLQPTKRKPSRKTLDVSGPVKSYHPSLKNFWYPVAFSADLKDGTMVKLLRA